MYSFTTTTSSKRRLMVAYQSVSSHCNDYTSGRCRMSVVPPSSMTRINQVRLCATDSMSLRSSLCSLRTCPRVPATRSPRRTLAPRSAELLLWYSWDALRYSNSIRRASRSLSSLARIARGRLRSFERIDSYRRSSWREDAQRR